MAKVIDMFPGMGKEKPEALGSLEGFIALLHAVVDGDKDAIEELRFILDLWEKMDIMNDEDDSDLDDDDDFDDDDEEDWDDEEDGEIDLTDLNGPMTLPRKEVKELHLRIKLNKTDQKIWREVKVPSNISLEGLAMVLLDVMGWEHEHLYQFVIDKEFYDLKMEDDDFFAAFIPVKKHDITKYALSDVLHEKGKRIQLDYDFGDGWEHDVWIKGEREYAKGEKPAIICVKGQGECPPEDCGGVWGYAELLQLREKKRLTADEKERLEWYDMLEDFDPDSFDKDFADECMEYWTAKL